MLSHLWVPFYTFIVIVIEDGARSNHFDKKGLSLVTFNNVPFPFLGFTFLNSNYRQRSIWRRILLYRRVSGAGGGRVLYKRLLPPAATRLAYLVTNAIPNRHIHCHSMDIDPSSLRRGVIRILTDFGNPETLADEVGGDVACLGGGVSCLRSWPLYFPPNPSLSHSLPPALCTYCPASLDWYIMAHALKTAYNFSERCALYNYRLQNTLQRSPD